MLDSLRARTEMAAASEAYLSDVGVALTQMQGRMEEIQRTNDRAAMREQIEILVPRIVVHTETIGSAPGGRARKQASVHLSLAFAQTTAVVDVTKTRSSRSRSKRAS